MPFNRFITASWGIGGIPADQAVGATSRFIGLARNWLRARGHLLAWVSVQERGKRVGQHAHILLHVPSDLAPLFRAMPRRWASTILPEGYRSGVINTKRLKSAGAINSLAYEAELLGNIHYMLKCAPIELEKSLDMAGRGHERWGQSCLVIGKRAGVWQQWKSIAAEAE